ncbi:P27 family phage terminase small subunit [Bacillus sp. ISL-46]|uniref:P27 family phage terminase small subunit n=1 Tax=Bacillus sp. ISL-46 TaxID=2819129 RepID=UPI001BEB10BC|nr:P27 family phage terminase small subunit [Bacillus sp. ISL-46]MBT2723058.1 P27 family phage terminase small subunit [Bacillus sp. ISL-46]
MAKPTTNKETIKKNTIRDMKSLGVYKPEYNPLINVYADLMSQYLRANREFEESGFQYETETAAGGTKKSAIVATLENLRKDLLAYSDRLCINPKSNNIDPPKPQEQSILNQFLSQQK